MSPTPPTPPVEVTEDEHQLANIAIRFDSAIRHYMVNDGAINLEFFNGSIDQDLELVNGIFDRYPTHLPGPRYHPIIEYVALKWDSTPDKNNFYGSFQYSAVTEMCKEKGSGFMGMVDLTSMVSRMPQESRWWLLPIAQQHSDADEDADMANRLNAAGMPAEVHEPVSLNDGAYSSSSRESDDEDMSEKDDGKTPSRVTRSTNPNKRTIIASPTQEPPARRIKVDDPDACGPCKSKHKECVPVPDKPAVQACLACTNQKIKCAPRAKWAEKRQKAGKAAPADQQRAAQQAEKEVPNPKAAKQTPETLPAGPSKQKEIKRNIFDDIDKLTASMQILEANMSGLRSEVSDCRMNVAAISNFFSGQGEMMHGRSIPSGMNLPSLRVPPPPPFQDGTAVAPSPSSAISNISSNSSTFHIGGLMLDSPHSRSIGLPVAGPSGVGRERQQVQAPGTMLRSVSEQAAAKPASNAPSVAGSRRSSRTRT